jgi:FkbM family methyltransferase
LRSDQALTSGCTTWIAGRFFRGLGAGSAAVSSWGSLGNAALGASNPACRLAKQSWAEHGEDLVIESLCRYLKIDKPTYLDIGAADPIFNSNTYLFYSKGCRGVLIEPNPSLSGALMKIRPGDRTINAGIGFDGRTEADYYMVSGALSNTFSKDWIDASAARLGNRDFIEKVIEMPLLNINAVIAEYFCKAPDLLSIDTEGLDFDILRSLDFNRFRPPIVCAETLMVESKGVEPRIIDLMRSKEYSVRGSTIQNAIFVDDRLLV